MLLYHYPTCTVQLSNSFLLLRGCTFSVCEECREFLKAKGLNSDKQKNRKVIKGGFVANGASHDGEFNQPSGKTNKILL